VSLKGCYLKLCIFACSVFLQNFASTKCVSHRCSTDSTPTCTPLYLRIVAALMKRIVARCTPNRRAESWNAPCATLTCLTFHTNVPADQIIRPTDTLAHLPSSLPLRSFFFSATTTSNFVLRGSTSWFTETHALPSCARFNIPCSVSNSLALKIIPLEEDEMFLFR